MPDQNRIVLGDPASPRAGWLDRFLDHVKTVLLGRGTEDEAAAAEYFRTEKPLTKLWKRLADEGDPRQRAQIITEAAAIEDRLAELQYRAWGPDPIEWEDGRDLSEAIANSARVLRLMASVETGVADGGRRRPTNDLPLEAVAGDVCDTITAAIAAAIRSGAPGAANRDVQHGRLYQAVVDTVGGQAAESLACLPSPNR